MGRRLWVAVLLVLGLVAPVAAQPGAALEYCSYIGGSIVDRCVAVAVGADRMVVTGVTESGDFPVTPGVWRESFNASLFTTDGFVMVLDANAHGLLASTFFGGSGVDVMYDVCMDQDGNVYVVGQTYSNDIPGSEGAFQPSPGAGVTGFVGSLSPDLRVLRWFTYVDSEGNWDDDADVTRHVIHDPAGYVYVAGYVADHEMFPVTGQLLPDPGGTYVLKLDDRDGSLVWCLDIGIVRVESLALAPEGDLIVSGYAVDHVRLSDDAFQTENYGHSSHYLLCLKSDGTFRWGTYLGGSSIDVRLTAVAATSDHVYFAGMTSSPDYPVRGTSWGDSYHGGRYDVVVGSLSGGGRVLDWCGFLGGSGSDGFYSGEGVGFRRDDRGHLFLYTSSDSPDLPVLPGAYQEMLNGSRLNGMVASVGEDGTLRWVSYFGGPEVTGGWDMALLPGRLIGTGSVSTWDGATASLPVTPDALSDTLRGTDDGYLFILHTDDIVPTLVHSTDLTWEAGTAVLRWRLSGNATDLRAEVVTGTSVRPLPLAQAPDGTWTARDEQACTGEAGPRTYRLVQPGVDHWTELWRQTVTPECAAAGMLRLAVSVAGGGIVRLRLESPAAGTARVSLYDLAGRRVASLPERSVAAGAAVSWEWDGRGLGGERLAGGRYVARCTVGGRSVSASVLLVR